MGYSKQGFVDGMTLTHTHLINMEEGILSAYSGGLEDVYASNYNVMPGKVDKTSFNNLLTAGQGKTIRFNDGVYEFDFHIVVPSDTSFIGNTKTIFKLTSDATSNILFYIVGKTNVTISRIKIDGGLTSQPAGSESDLFDKTGIGTRYGIWCEKTRRIKLHDIDVCGWDLAGLYCKNNDSGGGSIGRFFHTIELTNSSFYYNYYGLWYDEYGEYNQTSCCNFGDNYIGVFNCGGNNLYTGCMFCNNYCGFILYGSSTKTDPDYIINNSHGGCYCCTYNHNHSSSNSLGGGHAIYVKKCDVGWNWIGQNIWYGMVTLDNTIGNVFDGTICGNMTFKSFDSSGRKNRNLFVNTFFHSTSGLNTFKNNNDGSTYLGLYTHPGGVGESEITSAS